jgi:hypothetical protein
MIVSLVSGPLRMLFEGIVMGITLAVAADTLTSEGASVNPFSFCALILTLIGSYKEYPLTGSVNLDIFTLH